MARITLTIADNPKNCWAFSKANLISGLALRRSWIFSPRPNSGWVRLIYWLILSGVPASNNWNLARLPYCNSLVEAKSAAFIINRGAKLNISPPRDGSCSKIALTLNLRSPTSTSLPTCKLSKWASRGSTHTWPSLGIALTTWPSSSVVAPMVRSPRNGKPCPTAFTSTSWLEFPNTTILGNS